MMPIHCEATPSSRLPRDTAFPSATSTESTCIASFNACSMQVSMLIRADSSAHDEGVSRELLAMVLWFLAAICLFFGLIQDAFTASDATGGKQRVFGGLPGGLPLKSAPDSVWTLEMRGRLA